MKKLIIIITLSILALDAFAQRKVSGTVFGVYSEQNLPLIGALVIEKGTANGIRTSVDGEFELTTTRDSVELQIYSLGMLTESLKITSDSIIAITLQADEYEHIIKLINTLCSYRFRREELRRQRRLLLPVAEIDVRNIRFPVIPRHPATERVEKDGAEKEN